MNLEDIEAGERRHSPKDKYCVIPWSSGFHGDFQACGEGKRSCLVGADKSFREVGRTAE
jgi:hypothetical protein